MDTSSNQQGYTSVDTEDPELPLAVLIKEQLRDLGPISRASCIYRVPPKLRQVNEKFYTPQTVSIGPFHHGKKELEPWEEHKLRYLQAFLDRTRKSLEDCIKLVNNWEERARNCYRERIDLSSDAFVKMMLVDSCFIIEAMRRVLADLEEPTDYLSNPELIVIVWREMILLENQIPFFVLHGLFDFGLNVRDEDMFIKHSISYFSGILLTVTEESTFTNVKRHLESGFEIKHLTDLLRICHLPSDLQKPNMGSSFVPIPTATRVQEAGMEFKIVTSKRLLDMKYSPTGLLEMPELIVDDDTEYLLKNLIALETCQYPFDSYIVHFVIFMDMFIYTVADVDLLVQKGIIANILSDSATVASLFNMNMPHKLKHKYQY